MAKKKTAKAVPKKTAAPKARQRSPGERVGLMVRIPKATHEIIAKAAEDGGLSVNMLVEGILSACAGRLISGRPKKLRFGEEFVVTTEKSPGCFYCGQQGKRFVRYPASEQEADAWHYADRDIPKLADFEVGTSNDAEHGRIESGEIWFVLDHSSSPIRYGDE